MVRPILLLPGLVALTGLLLPSPAHALCPAPNVETFAFSGVERTFTVPADVREVTIEALGAGGGSSSSSRFGPGLGASMRGDFDVTPGESLRVLVGATPSLFNGGGGGSFVTRADSTPLVVAGGGGGSGDVDSPDKHAAAATAGRAGAGPGAGAGGVDGQGAPDGTGSVGGGGGLLTNGGDGCCAGAGGRAFVNGGAGGTFGSIAGGLGGGGAGDVSRAGGGGGGYSGGGGGGRPAFGDRGVGGGGGSFNGGRNPVSAAGGNGGNGKVTVCWEDPPPPAPGIAMETRTNGVDADDPASGDAPRLVPGEPVSWSYEVTNTGNLPLAGVAVSDDRGAGVSCPGSTLDVGESMVCTASASAEDLLASIATTVAGICGGDRGILYRNQGTAVGQSPLGQSVQAQDPSHYCNPSAPAIDIEKATNGADADDPAAGDAPQLAPGAAVQWSYVVRNTGNVALGDLLVTDDQGIPVTCPQQDTLTVGASMTCSASAVAENLVDTAFTTVAGACGAGVLYANTGNVSARSDSAVAVDDADASHYCNPVAPAIQVEKATNGSDADDPGAGDAPLIAVGDAVNWTYLVGNVGNVPLGSVTVTDDQGVTVSCPGTTLAVGAVMQCTASGIAENLASTTATTVAGSCAGATSTLYRNVATANGQGPGGQPVQDTDASHYCNPPSAGIVVEKATNGIDADNAAAGDAPPVPPGAAVTWTYSVTNIGNLPLLGVQVSDDRGVPVACPKTTLAASENMVCSASGIAQDLTSATVGLVNGICTGAVSVLYRNVATASGVATNGQSVSDTDASHYCNPIVPAIALEKRTNGLDADDPGTGAKPAIVPGDPVEWTYHVTNTGNTLLTGVAVSDDQGVAVSCPKSVLAVGESITCAALGVAQDLSSTTLPTVPGLCGTEVARLYRNIGEARGESALGQVVTHSDASHYCNPPVLGIRLEKHTNGVDADNPLAGDAPRIDADATVNWTYLVTNTGTAPLQEVTTTDDQGVAVSCPGTTLAVGETMTCTASAPAEDVTRTAFTTVNGLCGSAAGRLYRNVGTVVARSADARSVQDSDASHYCNPAPPSISACTTFNRGISLRGRGTRVIDVQRFFSIDPVSCPTGFVVAWAKTQDNLPIEWNHLSGSTYLRGSGGAPFNRTQAAQAIAILGDPANLVARGAPLVGALGGAAPLLPFDDRAYSQMPRVLTSDFFATAGARGGRLTLLDPDVNSPEANRPIQVDINWWNASGDRFSAAPLEFSCHVTRRLVDIDPGFAASALGSTTGQLEIVRRGGARILGVIEELEPNRATLRNLFHEGLASPSTIINDGGLRPGSALFFPRFDIALQNGVANRTVLRISNTFFDETLPVQPVTDIQLMLICGQGEN